jgi:hypothetical protein
MDTGHSHRYLRRPWKCRTVLLLLLLPSHYLNLIHASLFPCVFLSCKSLSPTGFPSNCLRLTQCTLAVFVCVVMRSPSKRNNCGKSFYLMCLAFGNRELRSCQMARQNEAECFTSAPRLVTTFVVFIAKSWTLKPLCWKGRIPHFRNPFTAISMVVERAWAFPNNALTR